MNENQMVAFIIAQAACAQIEAMAMQAHNNSQGPGSPVYSHYDFMRLIDKYGIHHNAVILSFGGGR